MSRSKAVECLLEAQKSAEHRQRKRGVGKLGLSSTDGGFPYLAESLRRAGILKNIWTLPSCQSIYFTPFGSVVCPGTPLVETTVDIPLFNREALIQALRVNQSGQSSFPEFLKASWEAGVISYMVDFQNRLVIYYGVSGDSYTEKYPAVDIES